MADKQDFNDDYQFADLDSGSIEPSEEEKLAAEDSKPSDTGNRNKIIRNAVIAVIIFVLAILIYNFFVSKKSQPTKTAPTKAVQAPIKTVMPIAPIAPIAPIKPVKPSEQVVIEALEQKMNALELGQHNMRDDVNATNSQLTSISTNISTMSEQITKLSQMMDTLSATVTQQSNTIVQLEARLQKPKPMNHHHRAHHAPAPIFYIQAVVPGRAWIISTNGSTLTVRAGSNIPGYGVVKLIDAQQGRVLTGSGRVIKFSQEDS